jgi:hypothetical protein
LVIPFAMVVLYILRHRAPEVMLPHRDDPVEAFVFDHLSQGRHSVLRIVTEWFCASGRGTPLVSAGSRREWWAHLEFTEGAGGRQRETTPSLNQHSKEQL